MNKMIDGQSESMANVYRLIIKPMIKVDHKQELYWVCNHGTTVMSHCGSEKKKGPVCYMHIVGTVCYVLLLNKNTISSVVFRPPLNHLLSSFSA